MSVATSTPSPSERALYRWLVIALIAASGVYGWYVFQRAERLSELNQRQLASAGMELRRALENAVATVDNFKPSDKLDKHSLNALCDFDDDQPYLRLTTNCYPSPGQLEHVVLATGSSLEIEARPKVPSPEPGASSSFVFAFDADVLLQELAFSESFQLVFVTNATGKVLVQNAPARRRWRPMLRWGEQTVRDSSADGAPGLQMHSPADALAGGSTAWQALSAASTRTTLQIGGARHQVYLQPLIANGVPLVIGGAVPTSTIVREALAVNGSFVATLVFFVLLSAFGYPFVKLSSLDRWERFRRRDVTLLYLSTAALLVLFTFAALGLDGSRRWQVAADGGLEKLARALADQFTTEVAAIRDEVEAVDADDKWLKSLASTHCKQAVRAWSDRPEERPRGAFLEQVAWIKPDGEQVWKITADKVGSLVRVDHRAYFKAVRDGELYLVAGAGTPFFIGPDRSITDGKFRTFVSISSKVRKDFYPCSETRYVVAATTQLLSLHRPALPAGYGFALVNREGHVLYHSNPRRSLRENLFEELGDGGRVRAIVYSGRDGALSSRYRQQPHRLFLEPIDLTRAGDGSHSGLYMVAFRDTSLEQTVVASVFVRSLAILLPLLACVGVTMCLAALISTRRRRGWNRWLWPHGEIGTRYRLLALLLSGVFIAALAGAQAGFSDAVLVVVPLVAVISPVVAAARYSGARSPRRSFSPWWYTAMLVLFLSCAVVVPAAVLFGTTLGHEFGRLVDTEQGWIRAQEHDALLELSAAARAEGYPESVVEQLARNRSNYSQASALPQPFNAVVEDSAVGASVSIAVLDTLDRRLPIESDLATRHRYSEGKHYSPPGSLPGPWRVTGVAMVCFAAMLALLVAWIGWCRNRIFYAAHESRSRGDAPSDFEKAWAECAEEERHLLIQVTKEGIANPHQQPLVADLIRRGLLRLDPDLQACSDAFQQFVRRQEAALASELASWERVHTGHGWPVRNGFVVLVGGLAFFLIATQPGLQSNLLGIATGLTGVLTTGVKLRDAIAPWFGRGKAGT
jgi:hypothetical protein